MLASLSKQCMIEKEICILPSSILAQGWFRFTEENGETLPMECNFSISKNRYTSRNQISQGGDFSKYRTQQKGETERKHWQYLSVSWSETENTHEKSSGEHLHFGENYRILMMIPTLTPKRCTW